VKEMLRHKKFVTPNASNNTNNVEEIQLNDSEEEVMVSASVKDVVDCVAKGEDQSNGHKTMTSNGNIEAEELNRNDVLQAVQLPDNLPQDLRLLIDKIKKVCNA